jgi:hypothetical protein
MGLASEHGCLETPNYVTEAFRLFDELIEQALSDDGDIA